MTCANANAQLKTLLFMSRPKVNASANAIYFKMFEIASAACMRHLARCGRHHGRLVSWRCLGSSSGAQNGEYRPIVGPGPSADRPYTDFDMSVGLERLEYLAKTHGINIFDNEWLPGDRFGTHGDPILVEATGDERIIGCTGT